MENPLSLADDIESPLERKRKPKVQKRRIVDLTSCGNPKPVSKSMIIIRERIVGYSICHENPPIHDPGDPE